MAIKDYAPEDDPHEPTNVPDELEERAHSTFAYTTRRSGSGHTRYVKPQTEEGYPDYALMLDLIGLEPGVAFEIDGRREIVIDRYDSQTQWGDWYAVENGAIKTVVDGRFGIETRKRTPAKEGMSPLTLWEYYIHGRVDVLGNVFEMEVDQ